MKRTLQDILLSVSWSDIAHRYFKKKGAWLYHKIDGVDKDGRPVEFTKEETTQLRGALLDLSERIRVAAGQIRT